MTTAKSCAFFILLLALQFFCKPNTDNLQEEKKESSAGIIRTINPAIHMASSDFDYTSPQADGATFNWFRPKDDNIN